MSARSLTLRGSGRLLVNTNMIMTDVAKRIKNTFQDSEAKMKTEKDHAEGKPSSETLNKAKVKTGRALT